MVQEAAQRQASLEGELEAAAGRAAELAGAVHTAEGRLHSAIVEADALRAKCLSFEAEVVHLRESNLKDQAVHVASSELEQRRERREGMEVASQTDRIPSPLQLQPKPRPDSEAVHHDCAAQTEPLLPLRQEDAAAPPDGVVRPTVHDVSVQTEPARDAPSAAAVPVTVQSPAKPNEMAVLSPRPPLPPWAKTDGRRAAEERKTVGKITEPKGEEELAKALAEVRSRLQQVTM